MHYFCFEWAVDVLKRVSNLDDKEEIVKAIQSTNMKDSVAGPIDFTAPVQKGTAHPVLNVVSTPLFEGQWVKGSQQPWSVKVWPYDLKVVINTAASDVPVQGPVEPLR